MMNRMGPCCVVVSGRTPEAMPSDRRPSERDRTTQKIIEPRTGPKTGGAPPSSMIGKTKTVRWGPELSGAGGAAEQHDRVEEERQLGAVVVGLEAARQDEQRAREPAQDAAEDQRLHL